MDTFYKVTSLNKNKNCYNIKPFNYNDLEGEINTITKRPILKDEINTIKNAFIRINNNNNSEIIKCCDPQNKYELSVDGKLNNNYDLELFNSIKNIYPLIRIFKDEEDKIKRIDFSKDISKSPDELWEPLSPYHICKLSNNINYSGNIWDYLFSFNVDELKDISSDISKLDDNTISLEGTILDNILNDCIDTMCTNDNITLKKLLKESKDDLKYNYYDDTKVLESIKSGDYEAVKNYLLKYKNSNLVLTVDDRRNSLLHYASKYYTEKIFDLLLATKADVDAKNYEKETPLHIGVKYGNFGVIEKLIKQGCNVNSKNTKGETPVMVALSFDDSELIKKNLEKKRNNTDYRMNFTMLKYLYNNGANLNSKDKNGNNLIHYTILNCPNTTDKSKIIDYLIKRGVNIEAQNKEKKTPLELVEQVLNESSENGKFENYGVKKVNYDDLTNDQKELLEIQRVIFNTIIVANPKKYKGYINVSKIPKGAPIEILYKQCSGTNADIIGLENEDECISKGGTMVDIENPTTLVKLELIPESEVAIENIDEEDLYFEKYPKSIDKMSNVKNNQNNNKTSKTEPEPTMETIYNSNDYEFKYYLNREKKNIDKNDLSGQSLNINKKKYDAYKKQRKQYVEKKAKEYKDKLEKETNSKPKYKNPSITDSKINSKIALQNGIKNKKNKKFSISDLYYYAKQNLTLVIVLLILLLILLYLIYKLFYSGDLFLNNNSINNSESFNNYNSNSKSQSNSIKNYRNNFLNNSQSNKKNNSRTNSKKNLNNRNNNQNFNNNNSNN